MLANLRYSERSMHYEQIGCTNINMSLYGKPFKELLNIVYQMNKWKRDHIHRLF